MKTGFDSKRVRSLKFQKHAKQDLGYNLNFLCKYWKRFFLVFIVSTEQQMRILRKIDMANENDRELPWPWIHSCPSSCPDFNLSFSTCNSPLNLLFSIYIDEGRRPPATRIEYFQIVLKRMIERLTWRCLSLGVSSWRRVETWICLNLGDRLTDARGLWEKGWHVFKEEIKPFMYSYRPGFL